ncbi:MAG TPA: hypothetical protein VJ992_09845 [Gemmatimonadales bacterium]|nr:hypothetical protein [Gemmatimonadales bacterium]
MHQPVLGDGLHREIGDGVDDIEAMGEREDALDVAVAASALDGISEEFRGALLERDPRRVDPVCECRPRPCVHTVERRVECLTFPETVHRVQFRRDRRHELNGARTT